MIGENGGIIHYTVSLAETYGWWHTCDQQVTGFNSWLPCFQASTLSNWPYVTDNSSDVPVYRLMAFEWEVSTPLMFL